MESREDKALWATGVPFLIKKKKKKTFSSQNQKHFSCFMFPCFYILYFAVCACMSVKTNPKLYNNYNYWELYIRATSYQLWIMQSTRLQFPENIYALSFLKPCIFILYRQLEFLAFQLVFYSITRCGLVNLLTVFYWWMLLHFKNNLIREAKAWMRAGGDPISWQRIWWTGRVLSGWGPRGKGPMIPAF